MGVAGADNGARGLIGSDELVQGKLNYFCNFLSVGNFQIGRRVNGMAGKSGMELLNGGEKDFRIFFEWKISAV